MRKLRLTDSGQEPPARRNCSKCGRWRLGIDFDFDHRRGLASQCKACKRLHVYGKRKYGTDYCQKGGHEYTPENTLWTKQGRRQCRACKREAQKKWNDAHKDDINEYHRIWGNTKRREQGLSERIPKRGATHFRGGVPVGKDEILYLPVEPFLNWLDAREALLDPHEVFAKENMAIYLGWNSRNSYSSFRRDCELGTRIEIHIDIADQAFQNAADHEALEAMYPLVTCKRSYYGEKPRQGKVDYYVED